ncbi:MAG: hypothetical protein ACK4NW_04635 [Roseinatronobacter sp.]
MKRVFLACLVACGLAGPVAAQGALSCGAAPNNWPLFERLKAHFLNAEYRAFLEASGPMLEHEVENYDAYFGVMDELFPEGFDLCQTVLVRNEEPAFRQEIVMYLREDMRGPITLLLTGVMIRGVPQLVYFNYNSTALPVLSELK